MAMQKVQLKIHNLQQKHNLPRILIFQTKFGKGGNLEMTKSDLVPEPSSKRRKMNPDGDVEIDAGVER